MPNSWIGAWMLPNMWHVSRLVGNRSLYFNAGYCAIRFVLVSNLDLYDPRWTAPIDLKKAPNTTWFNISGKLVESRISNQNQVQNSMIRHKKPANQKAARSLELTSTLTTVLVLDLILVRNYWFYQSSTDVEPSSVWCFLQIYRSGSSRVIEIHIRNQNKSTGTVTNIKLEGMVSYKTGNMSHIW